VTLPLPEFPTSRFERRFVWTWLFSPPVVVIWGITAWKGGDQWPAASTFCLLLFVIWCTPTAEQMVNIVKAASLFRKNPLDDFGWNTPAATPAPKVPDE